MTTEINISTLADIEFSPYIDDQGCIPETHQGKIGVYAIFDEGKVLQFVGYSRDVYLSLKQHLIRQPKQCYWVKVQTISRPSRAVLENIENAWIAENGTVPLGNANYKDEWTQPINVKPLMTSEEAEKYHHPANDELAQMKILKNIARRVEAEILLVLKERGLQEQFRFSPKLKEEGLLDLK
ncbi:GIY-YIG nuclease family protein [Nodularia harveyana UHCC-0300]|uniref:GIY-YIG nuclease family protein n=1 Tax=Nodularia harveyana UHCC-0300 TaxID=2974287 RepID=A0ABU5UG25_9CYAN|nr:GIY-YIG nuclease family protein [Nodularia harveyana]MEA5582045.1 GIY-YIG nuclease family protein [Nodularia harveyana UHCC-0300]